MNDGGWTDANVVAAAVRILGGAQKVANSLGVSRSQVYRWIKARSMARATYMHVAKLASLSGIDTDFLGGESSPNSSARESNGKAAVRAGKLAATQNSAANRTHRGRIVRSEDAPNGAKRSISGAVRTNWQEESDHHLGGEELGRVEVQKGGAQQTFSMESNGVVSGRGDHYGRKKTLRTKGQEESREHQP
jgi:hypothetical protein